MTQCADAVGRQRVSSLTQRYAGTFGVAQCLRKSEQVQSEEEMSKRSSADPTGGEVRRCFTPEAVRKGERKIQSDEVYEVEWSEFKTCGTKPMRNKTNSKPTFFPRVLQATLMFADSCPVYATDQ